MASGRVKRMAGIFASNGGIDVVRGLSNGFEIPPQMGKMVRTGIV